MTREQSSLGKLTMDAFRSSADAVAGESGHKIGGGILSRMSITLFMGDH